MSETSSTAEPSGRSPSWKWWACGLLLLATTINYMDRMTLNLTVSRVMKDVGFDKRGYGELESAFAYAFALGAVLVGWMADRWNVRWLYPAALLVWSAAGFLTGLADSFYALLACRFLLGFAEAGHWPCALRTTRHILPPAQRSMGNSILQSGAALGAIFTPLLILALPKETSAWRYPFLIVGAVGIGWVFLWLASVRASDLAPGSRTSRAPAGILLLLGGLFAVKSAAHWVPDMPEWFPLAVSVFVSAAGIAGVFWWLLSSTRDAELPRAVFFRRFCVLAVAVVAINTAWHFFRAWLPLFLQDKHRYSEQFMNWFMLGYYLAADLGSLAAGASVLLLTRRGCAVHGSRLAVFALGAGFCTLGAAAAVLPRGPALLAVLLTIGFASLGLFPNYYSFSQELSARHQGKVSGALGCCCWLSMAPLHEMIGDTVERTGSYALGMTAAGFAPLLGVAALAFFWGKTTSPASSKPA